jgi:hypothetical protein
MLYKFIESNFASLIYLPLFIYFTIDEYINESGGCASDYFLIFFIS